MSVRGDSQGNWAVTSDSPTGISNSIGIGVNVKGGYTNNETIYQSNDSTTTTTSVNIAGVRYGIGEQSSSKGVDGFNASVGIGLSAGTLGPVGVSQMHSNSTIVFSNHSFENYSLEEFMYDMLFAFVSPDAASNFDNYYDGQSDYNYGPVDYGSGYDYYYDYAIYGY